ncbi:aryl-alcohol dehydrogenase [Artomyces pyxidatus]|uniref:Aryl-alcohol dehydrogenase n=1 Tax=Artomyces pyxidatus TaxID=48021 RepID=A0ACB8SJB3_9AGAM|nr:aryl-alcohol dehydrogenase [Artomyces pyxidatus]
MSLTQPAPPPPTPLGRYRVLSPRAGIRVSPLALGAMSIGDQWAKLGMGAMDKDASFKLLDAYFDAGGNFIDTANNYQDETSEMFIGEWMETRAIRDQLVIATKYTTYYKHDDPAVKQRVNYVGNHIKSLHLSVRDSLRKLRTDYIDILYVHWWDWGTSIEEVVDSLHILKCTGKVLYLDAPAWVVVKANAYARQTGKSPFVIYEGQWNVLKRSFERDIIPMARAEGLALAPWDCLASGRLRTDAEEAARRASGEKGRVLFDARWERSPAERAMAAALDAVRAQVGAHSIQAVALAYLLHKTAHVFPIVGGRKVEHLRANIEALSISLSPAHIRAIEAASGEFDVGFPGDLIGNGEEEGFMSKVAAVTDWWPVAQPISPAHPEAGDKAEATEAK